MACKAVGDGRTGLHLPLHNDSHTLQRLLDFRKMQVEQSLDTGHRTVRLDASRRVAGNWAADTAAGDRASAEYLRCCHRPRERRKANGLDQMVQRLWRSTPRFEPCWEEDVAEGARWAADEAGRLGASHAVASLDSTRVERSVDTRSVDDSSLAVAHGTLAVG